MTVLNWVYVIVCFICFVWTFYSYCRLLMDSELRGTFVCAVSGSITIVLIYLWTRATPPYGFLCVLISLVLVPVSRRIAFR